LYVIEELICGITKVFTGIKHREMVAELEKILYN
jgi:hypothetical protein